MMRKVSFIAGPIYVEHSMTLTKLILPTLLLTATTSVFYALTAQGKLTPETRSLKLLQSSQDAYRTSLPTLGLIIVDPASGEIIPMSCSRVGATAIN